MRERTVFALTVLTLILLGVGYWAGSQVNIMPVEASTRAVLVDQLFRALFGAATVIFLIVEGALVYAVLRFRRRPDDATDAAPVHGHAALELVWTLIPTVLVTVIGVYSFQVLTKIELPGPNPMVVEVTSRQFSWEFHYPEFDLTSTELHLPVNQPVRFQIASEDVIHSFWVPAFRAKRDATPGQISELSIQPLEIGRYPVRCAELCGAGHAGMVAEVIVETDSDFDVWIQSQLAIPTDPIEAGRFLFTRYGCAACHTLTDAGAAGVVGPSLDGIGETAGTRVEGLDAEGYIRESLLRPSALVVAGFQDGLMPPNFGERISQQQLDILVNYLLGQ
ncbi:MAG: cytochrome c oxidase subunit II [Anaerolineales bacterium]